MEVYNRIKRDVLWILLSFLVIGYGLNQSNINRDGTDSPDARSGVHLRTDHGTGCQYLEGPRGGITPRLSRSGEHKGCT
jgi:hypothetical protein